VIDIRDGQRPHAPFDENERRARLDDAFLQDAEVNYPHLIF
jgi:hypothetical protein